MSEDRPAEESADVKPVPVPEATPAPALRTSLDDFCAALSATVPKTILISAFHAEERRAGRLRDVAADYRARFDGFRRRPAA